MAGDCSLGKGFFNYIVGQIKKLKYSPLGWSINLLLFCCCGIDATGVRGAGVEFGIHGGRGWQKMAGQGHLVPNS